MVPPALVRRALRRAGTHTVLTPDPRVLDRLRGMDVRRLGSGAPVDPRRAQRSSSAPVVLFAGRAESVRGIDTLLDCFPLVLRAVPDARLRLLLIPRPELDGLLAKAHAAGLGDHLDGDRAGVGSARGDGVGAGRSLALQIRLHDLAAGDGAAEALSVGLPTVATDVSCLRAVVEDGVNGMVVPSSPPRRSQRLVELLRHEALWKRYADAGPITVTRRLGWDQMAPNIGCLRRCAGIGVAQVAGRTPCGLSGPGLVAYVVSSDSTRIAVIDTWATCGLPTDSGDSSR